MKAAEKSKNGFVRCKFDTSWNQKRYRNQISFPYTEDTGRIFYDTKEKRAKEKIRRKTEKIMTEQGLTLEEYVEG